MLPQDWSCHLEAVPRGLSSKTQGTCITLLVPLRNVISERRRMQNRGEESRFRMEKKVVKMEKILVKMEKMEKMEKILVILEKIIVWIPTKKRYRDQLEANNV
jgi:hypothetical protein